MTLPIHEEVYRLARERIARREESRSLERRPLAEQCRKCRGQRRRFKREGNRWVDYPCEECR